MKHLLFSLIAITFLGNVNAQILTNTTWNVNEYGEDIGTAFFDGDTLTFSGYYYGPEDLATYEENGTDFSIVDILPYSCQGLVGAYTIEIVDNELIFTTVEDSCSIREEVLVFAIWTQLPTSSPEFEVRSLNLSPNPTTSFVTVLLDQVMRNTEFVLHDLSGRELLRHRSTDIQMSLDLSHLNTGVYVLSSTDGRYSQRIVKR